MGPPRGRRSSASKVRSGGAPRQPDVRGSGGLPACSRPADDRRARFRQTCRRSRSAGDIRVARAYLPAMADADVAIVGGGAGGTLVAIQLLRQARPPLSITLVEPGERLGRGVAYSTREPEHLLNVPAGKVSALPDAPDHFARWARSPVGAFVARGRYGDYLDETLRETAARAARDVSFQILRDSAISAAAGHGKVRLGLASGERLDAGIAVLALGNLPAADLAVDDGGLYA